MANEYIFNMEARHFWLRNRIRSVIDAIQYQTDEVEDWNSYIYMCKLFSEELHYAVTEWEKYYPKTE